MKTNINKNAELITIVELETVINKCKNKISVDIFGISNIILKKHSI